MGSMDDSHLKWYKVNGTGKYKVNDSSVARKGRFGIDIDVLKLRDMTSEMQGVYVCERLVYGATESTNASFNVIFKGKRFFPENS